MDLKIVVVPPPSVRIPVTGYGGIELAAQDMATELSRRGHEITLMGNLDDGPSTHGWVGRKIFTEADPITARNYELLQSADVVLDYTHSKVTRLAQAKRYWAVVMWTDHRGPSGQNIYPSEAVREAFRDPTAPVIPLGIPLDGIPLSDPVPSRYVCLGRIAPYKGQLDAIRIAQEAGVKLTVAGHTGKYADAYYTLKVRRQCATAGFEFIKDPPDLNALLDGASGLLHLHNWIESFSIVAAQSLIRGVPILTTNIGAVQEWVRRTDGGIIATPEELRTPGSDVTREFFRTNWAPKRAGIAKRARELFDVRRVAEQYEALWGAQP